MLYEPTAIDLEWAKNTISLLTEGGCIAMPGTGSIYRVSHKDKTITRLLTMDIEDTSKVYERSVIVFAELGYTVSKNDTA